MSVRRHIIVLPAALAAVPCPSTAAILAETKGHHHERLQVASTVKPTAFVSAASSEPELPRTGFREAAEFQIGQLLKGANSYQDQIRLLQDQIEKSQSNLERRISQWTR